MILSDTNPSFKVTLQFKGEYLSSSASYTAGNVTSRGFLSSS